MQGFKQETSTSQQNLLSLKRLKAHDWTSLHWADEGVRPYVSAADDSGSRAIIYNNQFPATQDS